MILRQLNYKHWNNKCIYYWETSTRSYCYKTSNSNIYVLFLFYNNHGYNKSNPNLTL